MVEGKENDEAKREKGVRGEEKENEEKERFLTFNTLTRQVSQHERNRLSPQLLATCFN